ncbi:MAG: hypothetical protein MUE74_06945 [Bacteroidales bacterium]|nr:hypothetical protein [Bacteroidales bacterium]
MPLLAVLAFYVSQPSAEAQEKKFTVGPGLSINAGYFNPKDVNAYIANELRNYQIFVGTSDMYLYYEASAFIKFKTRLVEFLPSFAYGISPKIVTGADEDFNFTRMSPGFITNFFIPVGFKGKYAFLLGGGVQYHMMNFEGYSGKGLGYRAQAGFDFQFGNFNLQPTIAYNIADVTAENPEAEIREMDLNYSGIQMGVVMSFYTNVNHRR